MTSNFDAYLTTEYTLQEYPPYDKDGNHHMAVILTGAEMLEIANVRIKANNDEVLYNIWYGIITGYNYCCIDFFTNAWTSEFFKDMLNNREFSLKGQNHLHCPDCIVNKLTKT